MSDILHRRRRIEDQPAAPGKGRTAGRSGRPSTALITRSGTAEKALMLIDRDGLEALSLQRVAKELGVSAPSIYHHFKDKEEVMVLVARRLLEEVGVERESWSPVWKTRMIELGLATRRVMLRHPHAAPLVLRFFPRRVMLQAYENAMADCPYPAHVLLMTNELIEHYTFGSALFAAAAESHHISAMPDVDPEKYPTVHMALSVAQADDEARFLEGLQVLLEGLDARLG